MFWFLPLLIIGLIVFVPLMVVLAGTWILVLAVPFLVFFGAWIVVAWIIVSLLHVPLLIALVLGFVIGGLASRASARKGTPGLTTRNL